MDFALTMMDCLIVEMMDHVVKRMVFVIKVNDSVVKMKELAK